MISPQKDLEPTFESAKQAVLAFAQQHMVVDSIEPINADASFRHYWRISNANEKRVVMDSPPSLVDIGPFVQLGNWLADHQISVPTMYAQDLNRRFLLLEDLGDTSLYSALKQQETIALLKKPLDVLVKFTQLSRPDFLTVKTKVILIEELKLFDHWCLAKNEYGAKPGDLDSLYELLADSALHQPQGFVHRDYHSFNIHICPNKPDGVGIIDFQDGLWGPATYDLISLLQDRYITWPEDELFGAIEQHRLDVHSTQSSKDYLQQTLWVGLQRNIRILGVFHRLAMRDNKPVYMNYVPRFASYC